MKKTFTRNIITLKKPFESIGRGSQLWTSKPNAKTWPSLCSEGFVLKHFYCYNQHEVIPWDCLTLKVVQIEEIKHVKKKITKKLTKKDFNFK